MDFPTMNFVLYAGPVGSDRRAPGVSLDEVPLIRLRHLLPVRGEKDLGGASAARARGEGPRGRQPPRAR